MLYEVYVDGAARGQGSHNEQGNITYGHGAAAAMIYKNKKLIGQYARGLGKVPNNVAEYEAILLGLLLCWPSQAIIDPVIYSDSQVAVKQINKTWKCNSDNLRPLLKSIQEIQDVYRFRLVQVPRKHVGGADHLANQFLDNMLEPPEKPKKSKRKR